jgi:hypothetical protein
LNNLLDEIVLGISNNAKSQQVQDGISLTIWLHRIGATLGHKLVKCVHIQLTCCYVDCCFAIEVFNEGVGSPELNQRFYYERVTAENRLIQRQFISTIDAWLSFLHQEVQDIEV